MTLANTSALPPSLDLLSHCAKSSLSVSNVSTSASRPQVGDLLLSPRTIDMYFKEIRVHLLVKFHHLTNIEVITLLCEKLVQKYFYS